MTIDYDILVIGGGMVGASLARALAGRGLRIGVVEAVPAGAPAQPSYDDRVIALAQGSRRILQGIGSWAAIADEAQPILRIHISDRGHFGFARLDHREEGVEALGYVVSARSLGQSLLHGLERQADLDLLCPAQLLSFEQQPERVRVKIRVDGAPRDLGCRLLVAADGGQSLVRRQLGIGVTEWGYGQTAIIANVTPGRDHQGVAYERFTDTGPLAMLPMSGGHCSLVWTARDAQVADIMGLEAGPFLARLQRRFGHRLGRLRQVGRRQAYPLVLRLAKAQHRPRAVLIGNAAHSLHPVAGQGFNLGLRDVAVLAELLAGAAARGGDPGAEALLQRYADWRRPDQHGLGLATDLLARLFANPLPPLQLARDLGLLSVDLLPGLRHGVARRFMGLSGSLPRLARGLPVD